ncbi:MAG: Eco57I restriction-modification methylase domain-containing protein [Anaerolineae bacterium]
MPWAVHVAELRLWLQLMVETEMHPAELKFRPLLPNLSFKVRPGDSLVQEVGGINFSLHRAHLDIPRELKGRLTQLKGEKLKFYNNDLTGKFRSETALKQEESQLFRDILAARQHTVDNRLKGIRHQLSAAQMNLAGEATRAVDAETAQALEAEAATLEAEREQVSKALGTLQGTQEMPFVWDIAFVEIFEGDNGGFDVVLGNPPYVRQERIAPPDQREDDFDPDEWRQVKREYKDKLQHSVAVTYPRFFSYKPTSGKFRKLDGKSDLYVYFYLHGLSLLNENGSFCFITSNSWLDVGYGKDLQEFLLKHSQAKMILDNEARRSFAQADVNTIIALLGPPDDQRSAGLDKTAHFVMFKVPFEEVLSPVVFQEIEEATDRVVRPEFRIIACEQRDLYEEGLATGEKDEVRKVAARYQGDKWGGKYLRAPEILFRIMANSGMIPVTQLATARLGVTSGANKFLFVKRIASGRYLTTLGGEKREVSLPDEYLHPVLRTASECEHLTFRASDTDYRVLIVDRGCRDTGVRNYIRMAEEAGVHQRPFFRGKQFWYEISNYIRDRIAVSEIIYSRYFLVWNPDGCVLNKNFYGFTTSHDEELIYSLLSCTFSFLFFELHSRKPGAGASGIGVKVANRLRVLNPDSISPRSRSILLEAGCSLRERAIYEIFDEVHQPDRRALDDVVFDALGLTQGEREAVYEAVVELVRKRLEKARSV